MCRYIIGMHRSSLNLVMVQTIWQNYPSWNYKKIWNFQFSLGWNCWSNDFQQLSPLNLEKIKIGFKTLAACGAFVALTTHLIAFVSPLKRAWLFISTIVISLCPRMICTKFDWNWPARSGEDIFQYKHLKIWFSLLYTKHNHSYTNQLQYVT
jgi:hypothetical protein